MFSGRLACNQTLEAPQQASALWVDTRGILQHLCISRTTLDRLRQEGVLVERRHYVKKNPTSSRGVFLWNTQRCDLALDRV